MGMSGARVAILVAVLVSVFLGTAREAGAAPGRVVSELAAPNAAGARSIAFDGDFLYYTDGNGLVLHGIAPTGASAWSVPIVGAVGVQALAHDQTRGSFWAVDASGINVFRLGKDGIATPEFTIIPALDLPGSCKSLLGCSTKVSIAYDATSDSLWYLPEGSPRVYRFDAAGHPVGYFDLDLATNGLGPECAPTAASGIAAGRDHVYLVGGSCSKAFQYEKGELAAATKLATYSSSWTQAGDIECDDVTYGTTVGWLHDASTGRLVAIELPQGTCVRGGGVNVPGPDEEWFNGGGSISGTFLPGQGGQVPDVAVHTGFVSRCTPNADPTRFTVTWQVDPDGPDGAASPETHRAHVSREGVTEAECTDSEEAGSGAPAVKNNQNNGSGTGRYSGSQCSQRTCAAKITWTLIDHGEPAEVEPRDVIKVDVFVAGRELAVLGASCGCIQIQAHGPKVSG